jgi:phosphonate degradation associated HDIG domain protein
MEPTDPIAHIVELVERFGADQYGNEAVTQRAHALQCAALAEAAGARPSLIAGALLHDLGHLLDKHAELGRLAPIDRQHERVGAGWVAQWFQPEVAEMVRLHVPAKRWLCQAEPGYFDTLSPGSVRSLGLQGGPFTADQAAKFRAKPHAEDAIAVRRWDDLAKRPDTVTPPLAHFIPALRACLL